MIRPTPTVTDPQVIADIEHELEFGTPDTPQRIAQMKRADAAYWNSMGKQHLLEQIKEWIARMPHRRVEAAWGATLGEFRLRNDWNVGKMHMSHLLHFIETLAEQTL